MTDRVSRAEDGLDSEIDQAGPDRDQTGSDSGQVEHPGATIIPPLRRLPDELDHADSQLTGE